MHLSEKAKNALETLKTKLPEPWCFARPISNSYWGVDYFTSIMVAVQNPVAIDGIRIYELKPIAFEKAIKVNGFYVPSIEDAIIIELYSPNPISAYLLYKKNERKIDKKYLYARILEEGLLKEASASLSHFDSFKKFIGKVNVPILSREEIENKIAESYEIPPYRSFEEIVNQALEFLDI